MEEQVRRIEVVKDDSFYYIYDKEVDFVVPDYVEDLPEIPTWKKMQAQHPKNPKRRK